MDAEAGLLSKVVWSGELTKALEAGISGKHFHDEEHGAVWDWIAWFYREYGTSPGRDAVRTEYPNYRLVKTPEPLQYYVDRLLEAHKRFETLDLLMEASTLAQDEKIDDAIGVMADGLLTISTETTRSKDDNVVASWEDRLARYEELEAIANGGLMGVPTGFPTIDKITGGLQAEQMTVVIGPQKAGKSAVLLKMAMAANDAGHTVLYVSFEMSNEEMGARYDGLRAGFNYNKILNGTMLAADKEKLRAALQRQKENPPLIFVHDPTSTTTMTAVTAKIHQVQPDIVFIDGVYMMDSEIPGVEATDTKSLTKISRATKRLAQAMKIPIVISTQALDWKWSPKQGLTAKAAGYTSAFGQDCDWMFGAEPPDDDGQAKFRLITGRRYSRELIMIDMDWDKGRIEEMVTWGGGDDEEGDDGPVQAFAKVEEA